MVAKSFMKLLLFIADVQNGPGTRAFGKSLLREPADSAAKLLPFNVSSET